MLKYVSASLNIFLKHMPNESIIHGEKNGNIMVYNLDITAEEIWDKFEIKEQKLLTQIGWMIDDGAFVLEQK